MSNAIVDWEYYSSLHSKVSESNFDNAEALAEQEVRLVVGYPRWVSIDSSTWCIDQLKDCICNTMDKMVDLSKLTVGVTSVSNDGYSESYAMQTDMQVKADLQGCIRSWLSGTGLAGAY